MEFNWFVRDGSKNKIALAGELRILSVQNRILKVRKNLPDQFAVGSVVNKSTSFLRNFSFLPPFVSSVFTIIVIGFFAGCGNGTNNDIDYVAIGASDATGVGANPITEGYVYRIRKGLDERGKKTGLINLGIPGAEIGDIKSVELPAAVEVNPDLITVFIGANDIVSGNSTASFEDDLHTILSDLRAKTDAFIVVGTLPDLTKTPRFVEDPDPDVTAERLSEYNDAILRQASEIGAAVVDLRTLDINDDVTASDGYHPNGDGYEIIANKFLEPIIAHFLP